jgi:hypothetical protein
MRLRLVRPGPARLASGLLALTGIASVVLASMPPASGASLPSASFPPTPLATSVQTASGTWATLPMGRLGEPLNTFWQLFYQPSGSSAWSDHVRATATATNGGLVLASGPGQPLIAGVLPSHLLRFSPLIDTSDGGHSWSEGLLSEGLASSPSALSTGANGHSLALVGAGLGSRVLASARGISKWHTLVTAKQLAASPGGVSCGVVSLSVVDSLPSDPLVGAACGHPGVVGLFTGQGGRWRLGSLVLPAALRRGRAQVLMADTTGVVTDALLRVVLGRTTALLAAWTTPDGRWDMSSARVLNGNGHLVSIGADGTGLYVLSASSSGSLGLLTIDGPTADWQAMPSPPAGTATVAFNPAAPSTVEALAVAGTVMTVWSLDAAARTWSKGQVTRVNIKFGSSS